MTDTPDTIESNNDADVVGQLEALIRIPESHWQLLCEMIDARWEALCREYESSSFSFIYSRPRECFPF